LHRDILACKEYIRVYRVDVEAAQGGTPDPVGAASAQIGEFVPPVNVVLSNALAAAPVSAGGYGVSSENPNGVIPPAQSLGGVVEGAEHLIMPPGLVFTGRATNKQLLSALLDQIRWHPKAGPFLRPVQLEEAPRYLEIIRTPMDFGTINQRIEDGLIKDAGQLFEHLSLVYTNAYTYNARNTDVWLMAKELDMFTVLLFQSVLAEYAEYFRQSTPEPKRGGRKPKPVRGNVSSAVATANSLAQAQAQQALSSIPAGPTIGPGAPATVPPAAAPVAPSGAAAQSQASVVSPSANSYQQTSSAGASQAGQTGSGVNPQTEHKGSSDATDANGRQDENESMDDATDTQHTDGLGEGQTDQQSPSEAGGDEGSRHAGGESDIGGDEMTDRKAAVTSTPMRARRGAPADLAPVNVAAQHVPSATSMHPATATPGDQGSQSPSPAPTPSLQRSSRSRGQISQPPVSTPTPTPSSTKRSSRQK